MNYYMKEPLSRPYRPAGGLDWGPPPCQEATRAVWTPVTLTARLTQDSRTSERLWQNAQSFPRLYDSDDRIDHGSESKR
jgi:hypothetical protein